MTQFFSTRIVFGFQYFLAAMVVAVISMACVQSSAAKGKNPPPLPVTVDSLKFETPTLKKRFQSFDAAARQVVAEKGFEHETWGGIGGNLVKWTSSKGIDIREPRVILRGPIDSLKLIHRVEVSAIGLPIPATKAVGFWVQYVAPKPDQWCVYVSYLEGANQNFMATGWSMKFFRWDPAAIAARAYGGPEDHAKDLIEFPISRYSASATTIELASNLSLYDGFLRYAKSADAMRDVCLADLAELEARVVKTIAAHKCEKQVYEKSRRLLWFRFSSQTPKFRWEPLLSSLPPKFQLEPLTAEEEKAELARANEHFAAQAQLVRTHHREMYEVLRKSFPLERCWPELAEKK